MYTVILDQKTGFRIRDVNCPVIVRDFRGVLFYTTEPLVPRVKEFNLPQGKYLIDGPVSRMEKPVKYNLLSLPNPERKMSDPFDFEVLFGSNPHKCTIDFKKGTIFFDNIFKEKPLPEVYFILYHEFAHQYFKTEKYTDALASNYMLIKGFNPSQIGRAHVNSLSSRQIERKEYNINKIIEANGRTN
jgi:hypothetical protein